MDGKWISVQDRLPEITKKDLAFQRTLSDWVLVVDQKSMYKEHHKAYYAKNGSQWLTRVNGMLVVLDNVTHWQPLPPPPEATP